MELYSIARLPSWHTVQWLQEEDNCESINADGGPAGRFSGVGQLGSPGGRGGWAGSTGPCSALRRGFWVV
jgi:hypothetical protein